MDLKKTGNQRKQSGHTHVRNLQKVKISHSSFWGKWCILSVTVKVLRDDRHFHLHRSPTQSDELEVGHPDCKTSLLFTFSPGAEYIVSELTPSQFCGPVDYNQHIRNTAAPCPHCRVVDICI